MSAAGASAGAGQAATAADVRPHSAWRDFLGGFIASLSKLAIGHPFDTMKVRLQSLNRTAVTVAGGALGGAAPALAPATAVGAAASSSSAAAAITFGSVIRQTWRYEGLRGFYRGVTPNLPGLAAYNSTLFWGFGQCSNLVVAMSGGRATTGSSAAGHAAGTDDDDDDVRGSSSAKTPSVTAALTLPQVGVAGAGAGVLASLVVCPLELVRCRLQVQYGSNPLAAASAVAARARYKGPLDLLRQTLAVHSGDRSGVIDPGTGATKAPAFKLRHLLGVGGLYKGFGITLLREVPSNVCYFATFEAVLRAFGHGHAARESGAKQHHSDASAFQLWVAGGLAGVANWLSIYPVDTVKSRLQTDDLYHPKYRNARDCYRQTILASASASAAAAAAASTSGSSSSSSSASVSSWWRAHRVLWSGLTPCLLRAFLANGVAFIALNASRRFLYDQPAVPAADDSGKQTRS